MNFSPYVMLALLSLGVSLGLTVYIFLTPKKALYEYHFLAMSICVSSRALFSLLALFEEKYSIVWNLLKFVSIYPLAPLFFMFTLNYAYPNKKRRPLFYVNVFLIPAAAVLLTFTNKYHNWFFYGIDVFSKDFIYYGENRYSPLFYIYLFYSYALVLFSSFVIYFKIKKTYKTYWAPYLILIFSSVFSMVINIFSIYSIYHDSNAIDYTLIIVVIAQYVLFNSILRSENYDLFSMAKDVLFENMSSIALVLDLDGIVLQINNQGKQKFSKLNISPIGIHYDTLVKEWFKTNSGEILDDESGLVICVQDENKKVYYQVIETSISDKKGQRFGTIVEFQNITKHYELYKRLKKISVTDELTGVYNRRFLRSVLDKFDKEEYLPLSVIYGDVNSLKNANDTMGHDWGDKILKEIADILQKNLPTENSFVFRVGGDEFVTLIANSDEDLAQKYINCVYENCRDLSGNSLYNLSISLGYGIKRDVNQSIDEVFSFADRKMYAKKNKEKSFDISPTS